MLAQILIAPQATLLQVGWRLAIPMFLIGGALSGAILGPGVSKPGHIGAPEYATLALVMLFMVGFLVKSCIVHPPRVLLC